MLRTLASSNLRPLTLLEEMKKRRWLWCLLAVVIVGVRHFLTEGAPPTGPKYQDTDDALRLLQVREFLIHGNWYDLRLPTMGAPDALVSHWSRLIDLPVAFLISIFALFLPYLAAETAASIVWPLLLLFGLARFLVYEAERQADARAGFYVLILLLLCSSGLSQFMPGRVDHHNAQILFAVLGMLLVHRALKEPNMGWYAGAALAIGLVVGYEALPLLAVTVGVGCLIACFDKASRPGITRTVIALALGLLAGLMLTVHPTEWLHAECDKLGINLVALCGSAAVSAAILWVRFRQASPWIWVGGFALSGVVGLGLFLAANPVCTQGAFTGIDPVVQKHWLSIVIEGQSLISYFALEPAMVIAYVVTMAIASAVVVHTAIKTPSSSTVFMATVTLLATFYGFYYMKLMSYAPLFVLVPMACWISRLPAMGSTPVDAVRVRAIILVNQTLYVVLATSLIGFYSSFTGAPAKSYELKVQACMTKSDISALAKLPTGLVIADRDLGPFVALSTRHRVFTGPYHRLHKSIRDLIVLLKAPVAEAGALLSKMNGDYLVLCGAPEGTPRPNGEAKNFGIHMRHGGSYPGLEPISIGQTEGPIKVWKITK